MGKLTVVILSIALALPAIILVALPYMASRLSETSAPATETSANGFLIKVNNNTYIATNPPSWAELLDIVSNSLGADASYTYVYPRMNDVWMIGANIKVIFMNSTNPCKEAEDLLSSLIPLEHIYKPLIDNDCKLLKKFFFGTEREWITLLGFAEPLASQYASRYTNYSVVEVFYKKNSSAMEVRLFNIADDSESTDLIRYVEDIVRSNRVAVLLFMMFTIPGNWYDLYSYLESRGIPYAVIVNPKSNTYPSNPLNKLIEPYITTTDPMRMPKIESDIEILVYVDGVLKGVATHRSDTCNYIALTMCKFDDVFAVIGDIIV